MQPGPSKDMHRWESLCRLLLAYHPKVGADLLSVHLNERRPYKVGWNVVDGLGEKKYIFISESVEESSKHTSRKPHNVPESEMHHVRREELPALQKTTAWKWITRAALDAKHSTGGWQYGERIDATMKLIISASELDYEDATPAEEQILKTVTVLNKLVLGRSPVDKILAPVLAVAEEFLQFKRPGMLTFPVVANAIDFLCLRGRDVLDSAPEREADAVKHLAGRTYDLLKYRAGHRIDSFSQITYFAVFLAETCKSLVDVIAGSACNDARELQGYPPPVNVKLALRRRQNVEEMLVHEATPYLTAFAMPSLVMMAKLAATQQEALLESVGDANSQTTDITRLLRDPEYSPFAESLKLSLNFS